MIVWHLTKLTWLLKCLISLYIRAVTDTRFSKFFLTNPEGQTFGLKYVEYKQRHMEKYEIWTNTNTSQT
jgi:hypothetical protein